MRMCNWCPTSAATCSLCCSCHLRAASVARLQLWTHAIVVVVLMVMMLTHRVLVSVCAKRRCDEERCARKMSMSRPPCALCSCIESYCARLRNGLMCLIDVRCVCVDGERPQCWPSSPHISRAVKIKMADFRVSPEPHGLATSGSGGKR